MRGSTMHDETGIKDPLLRAIAEMRDQVDRLIDEQKSALGSFLGGLVEEPGPAERTAPAPEPPLGPVAPAPEAAPKVRRTAQPGVFDRVDDPSPTTPRPAAQPTAETPGAGRSEDPRERLDALAKHLDRKLKQAGGGPPADSPARPAE